MSAHALTSSNYNEGIPPIPPRPMSSLQKDRNKKSAIDELNDSLERAAVGKADGGTLINIDDDDDEVDCKSTMCLRNCVPISCLELFSL